MLNKSESVESVSLLSRVWLFVAPRTLAGQAPLSTGILQARILELVVMLSSFLTQGLNLGLPHCRQIL